MTKKKHTSHIFTTALRTALLLMMVAGGMNGAWGTDYYDILYGTPIYTGSIVSGVNVQTDFTDTYAVNHDFTDGNNNTSLNLSGSVLATSTAANWLKKFDTDKTSGKVYFSGIYQIAANTNQRIRIIDSKENVIFGTAQNNTGNNDTQIVAYICGQEISNFVRQPRAAGYGVDLCIDLDNKTVDYTLLVSSNDGSTTTLTGQVTLPYDNVRGIYFAKASGNDYLTYMDNVKLYHVITKHTYEVRNSLGTMLATGEEIEGTTVTTSYPKYVLNGSILYSTSAQSSDPHYGKKFTVTTDNQVETITYTQHATGIIAYREAENFLTPLDGNNNVYNRCSDTRGGYALDYTDILTIASGAYNITAASYANSSTQFKFRAGGTDVFTHTGNGGWSETSSGIIQIAQGPVLQVSGGNHNYALDYVYVQCIFAFELPSSTRKLSNRTGKPTLINTTGSGATFSSSNTYVATVANDGTITFLHEGVVVITATAGGYTSTHTMTIVDGDTPPVSWSSSSVTVDILGVGNSNPNVVTFPTLTHRYDIASRNSSNTNVATFYNDELHIRGVGTTTITATDEYGSYGSYTLTVTGTTVTPTITEKSLKFESEGVLINSSDNTSGTYTLSKTGLTIEYNYGGETAMVVNSGMGNVLKIIDNNGFSHPNITNNIPAQDRWGGTFVKLTTADIGGHLTVTGNVDTDRSRLYKSDNTQVQTTISGNKLTTSLEANSTYFLYNLRTSADKSGNVYVPMVNSIEFKDAYFDNSSVIIEIPTDGNYTIQTPRGMNNPSYSLKCYGDVGSPTVSGGTITDITGGGAIKITASEGTSSTYYVLTVAYKASSGKKWTFNVGDDEHLITSTNLKGVEPVPLNTAIDDNGDTWTARYKNPLNNNTPEWRLDRSVDGDNAIIVNETAGLLFHTGTSGFYMNDYKTSAKTSYKHIGICGNASSFTIPYLKAGNIVEINWRHFTDESGASFAATNLKDLRNKPINETFKITKSQDANQRGWYSFEVVANGDVTFTLQDDGYTDILSVRIYEGPYVPTMAIMKDETGRANAVTQMLLDNTEQSIKYGICQSMNSTGTGPAYCVLKGYRSGEDNIESVSGYNSPRTGYTLYHDENAYPITEEEKTRLYELRKNLVDFRMWNTVEQSTHNSYNYAHISAKSGWGKVTIRMNNYTNDMKYLIGYTPDYTLTIGSAPHQEYSYTWDFTHISAQEETGKTTNVYNSIKNSGDGDEYYDEYITNWNELASAKYVLKTDNSNPLSSQYVPGAVLVTTNRALSKYRVDEGVTAKYALDEFDGLGVEGQIAFETDGSTTASARSMITRSAGDVMSLLSMQVDDYLNKTVDTDGDVNGGTFAYRAGDELNAGNGKVVFGADKFEFSSIATCGFGFKSDGDVGSKKYILLKPLRSLQVGDVINLKAYATSNPSGSDYGLSLYTSNTSDATPVTTLYLEYKQKNVEVTLSYTVTAGDALVGQSSVYVFRAAGKSTYITEAEIIGEPPTLNASLIKTYLYCAENVTLTIPDLNDDGKQDWIYVAASAAPTSVDNATIVESGDDGPDGNPSPELEDANARVYKYKVENVGNAYITFAAGTKIYKIGVTHILKGIHSVGGTGWATESRDHSIDHALTGYFTVNDVNAYTVSYDSYDLNTATVALTPINEDGYVAANTGMVLRLDNGSTDSGANLTKANSEQSLYRVPLFYPSYTLGASSTPTTFPTSNLMYPNLTEATHTSETETVSSTDYTKFLLTNIHWTYDSSHSLNTDEAAGAKNADAAGFYRMHIWETTGDQDMKNTLAANTAYLLVPTDNLPLAVWNQQSTNSSGSARRDGSIAIVDANCGVTDISAPTADGHDGASNGPAVQHWYTVGGMKLQGEPKKAGLYISHGRKVMVKGRQSGK